MPTPRNPLTTAAITLIGLSAVVGYSAIAGPAAASDPDRRTPRAGQAASADPYSCDPANPGLGILQVWVPRSDVDQDRRVTYREFAVDADESFRTWDVDVNGTLAGPEVARLVSESVALLTTESQRENYLCITTNPPASVPPSTDPGTSPTLPDLVSVVDRNGDGTVSTAEWRQSTRTRYDAINCNQDRFINYSEAFRFGRGEPCA